MTQKLLTIIFAVAAIGLPILSATVPFDHTGFNEFFMSLSK